MAGGTAVLGSLVAGPALAVLGVVMGAKASKNLDAANANWAKAKEFEEEMKTAADLCNGIRRRSAMFNRFLIRLQTVFDGRIVIPSRILNCWHQLRDCLIFRLIHYFLFMKNFQILKSKKLSGRWTGCIHILRDFIHGERSLFYFAQYIGKSFD